MSNPFGISLEKCLSCETNQHPSEHSPLSSLHHASLKPLSFSLSLSLCVLSFTSPTRSSVYWNIARKENPSFHPLSKTRNIRPNETLRRAKIFFGYGSGLPSYLRWKIKVQTDWVLSSCSLNFRILPSFVRTSPSR